MEFARSRDEGDESDEGCRCVVSSDIACSPDTDVSERSPFCHILFALPIPATFPPANRVL